MWAYSRKRAVRDRHTLTAQENRARAVIDGEASIKSTRFVKTSNGDKSLDEAALARARALAGLKGYVTNIPATIMGPGEVISSYHDLWHVEASFRMSKTDLAPRPMFHHTRDAIEAHLTIVFAALAVGRLAFDVTLPRQAAGYLLALVLAVLAALALGSVVSAVSRTTKMANAIGTVVYFPMMFCAGVWLPVQAMPHLMARVVGLTPFGAAARALGEAAAGHWPGWDHLGVLALWTVLLTAAAARWFRWE